MIIFKTDYIKKNIKNIKLILHKMPSQQSLDHKNPEECMSVDCPVRSHVEFAKASIELGDERIKHTYTNKKTQEEVYINAAKCDFRTNCRDQCHKAFWYSRYEHQHTDKTGKVVPFYMCNFGTNCRSYEHRELAQSFDAYERGSGYKPRFFYLRKRPERGERNERSAHHASDDSVE